MANGEVTTGEIMGFLKEHMVTKEDLKDALSNHPTKAEFTEFKSDLLMTVDRFAKLHETLDTELVSMRGKYERLESRLEVVERKLGLAGT